MKDKDGGWTDGGLNRDRRIGNGRRRNNNNKGGAAAVHAVCLSEETPMLLATVGNNSVTLNMGFAF